MPRADLRSSMQVTLKFPNASCKEYLEAERKYVEFWENGTPFMIPEFDCKFTVATWRTERSFIGTAGGGQSAIIIMKLIEVREEKDFAA